jgi:hypothetical protein
MVSKTITVEVKADTARLERTLRKLEDELARLGLHLCLRQWHVPHWVARWLADRWPARWLPKPRIARPWASSLPTYVLDADTLATVVRKDLQFLSGAGQQCLGPLELRRDMPDE